MSFEDNIVEANQDNYFFDHLFTVTKFNFMQDSQNQTIIITIINMKRSYLIEFINLEHFTINIEEDNIKDFNRQAINAEEENIAKGQDCFKVNQIDQYLQSILIPRVIQIYFYSKKIFFQYVQVFHSNHHYILIRFQLLQLDCHIQESKNAEFSVLSCFLRLLVEVIKVQFYIFKVFTLFLSLSFLKSSFPLNYFFFILSPLFVFYLAASTQEFRQPFIHFPQIQLKLYNQLLDHKILSQLITNFDNQTHQYAYYCWPFNFNDVLFFPQEKTFLFICKVVYVIVFYTAFCLQKILFCQNFFQYKLLF
ncbi:transmembrane protein, putative (macronuclear) [Tetrahymena thermophila SB210]|uniref:Transmembrane protein, putative n=1 Tax=Tetrahymena thermophila (strain SB210) TaxID=312017 RepID=W7XJC0_TETTS|nr:transmembrane protein, putative [Tetrahymena thermophila SB210]EWS74029.1 transmembrane protein, putative [Tetrahymena thermophila SB210]|eukprot:XP_012653428.1 transmembrane protein, putative [Tetrahymena thermophila SB210]